MDFELPETHQLLKTQVRAFAEREVKPNAKRWDQDQHFPAEIVPRLAELGLLGIRIPEAYFGAGLDMLAYAVTIEEIARIDGSLALTLASHNGLGTGHILAVGTEEQKQKYLSKAAHGEWLAAWALTEPGSGSDAAAMKTVARRDGSGWVIRGTKSFITQGSVAGFCVVLARTRFDGPAQRGITAFIVETSKPGYSAGKKFEKYGCRASDTVEVTLDDVRVEDSDRLGEIDRGFFDTMRILDAGRVSIAAMALGLGQGALEMALDYAKARTAFGQPIAEFQAIQTLLADAATELSAARLLTYRAAWLADRGLGFSAEASMAKLFASETATRVCNDALQIHGGYGYTREFAIERHLRDAKLCEIGEGTSQIQRIVIAKHLLR